MADENKYDSIYVRGVVIACDVPDSDGDVLDKKSIKKIFTNYTTKQTDAMHTKIMNDGVEILENYITENETMVKDKSVPPGSWVTVLKIWNPNIKEAIIDGKLTGFSLGSVTDELKNPNHWIINKSLRYSDVDDAEKINPLFISLVDAAANGYEFEVVDYTTYIEKNRKNDIMENDTEEKVSINAIKTIRDLFSINKAEEIVDKEDTPPGPIEEPEEGTPVKVGEEINALNEKVEKLNSAIEQVIELLNTLEKSEPQEPDEEDTTKDETGEGIVEKNESTESEAEETIDEESQEPETENNESGINNVEDAEIIKSTEKLNNTTEERSIGFYEKAGRDLFGRRIRK